MLAQTDRRRHHRHQGPEILFAGGGQFVGGRVQHQVAQQRRHSRRVQHDQQAVAAVEFRQSGGRTIRCDKLMPAAQGQNLIAESLPQPDIVDGSIIDHRQQRQRPPHRLGEQSAGDAGSLPVRPVARHFPQTATGRFTFENISVQSALRQLRHPAVDVMPHQFGIIPLRIDGAQTIPGGVSHQVHRFARHRQSTLRLGANRHPLHPVLQAVPQKIIQLMTAVIADTLPQKTTADAKFYHKCAPACPK